MIVATASALLLFASQPSATEQWVGLPDGIELKTLVIRPDRPGATLPAILVRTPYDLKQPDWAEAAVANGVVLVFQAVRGRGGSEGEFCFFRCEAADGAATVKWITQQPWSNGVVVARGSSAPGMNAMQAARAAPVGLVGVVAHLAHGDAFSSTFPGGVFRENTVMGWLGAVVPDIDARGKLRQAFAAHTFDDDYWEAADVTGHPAEVTVPIFHITGWYDFSVQGAVDAYVSLNTKGGQGARGQQFLFVSPFGHAAKTKAVGSRLLYGDIELPRLAQQSPFGTELELGRQFADHLAHQASLRTLSGSIPNVVYFVFGDADDAQGGGNAWRRAKSWPPRSARRRFYLSAASLVEGCPQGAAQTEYRSDPASPTPTVGGTNLRLPSGPFDQRSVEQRDDVVVFTSEPFAEATEIVGRVRAHLVVTVDAPDADLVVRVTDVYPDGRSILLRDAGYRLATAGGTAAPQQVLAGKPITAEVEVGDIANVFSAGHRLRLSVASTNAPKWSVNPGDGAYLKSDAQLRSVRVAILHSTTHASYLEVPVVRPRLEDGAECVPGRAAPRRRLSQPPSVAPVTKGCGCQSIPTRGCGWLSLVLLGLGCVFRRR